MSKSRIEQEIIFLYELYQNNLRLKSKYLKLYIKNNLEIYGYILDNINKEIENDIQEIKSLYNKYSNLNLDIDKNIYNDLFVSQNNISNEFYLYSYN